MMKRYSIARRTRRGAALVLAATLMFVLFSMLAFTIDTGYLAQTRAELTRCADSAALGGCSAIHKQLKANPQLNISQLQPGVIAAADQVAALNPVNSSSPSLASADISIGYTNQLRGGGISSNANLPFYAVRVKVQKSGQLNGEVPYFFGKLFGLGSRSMEEESTAVMAKHISGFRSPTGSETLGILPFALDLQTWQNMLASSGSTGSDKYSYNSNTGGVTVGGDGILEVNLFPQGTGSPGNRGTVDIGSSNNSTNDIKRQIVSGISASDLAALGKDLKLDDSTGTLTLNGDTGISAGVQSQLQQIVGQTRVIPLFSTVSGNGNNANYTIVKFAGVRVMAVNLNGSLSSKHLTVQPAPIVAKHGRRSTTSSHSDFVYTPVMLTE